MIDMNTEKVLMLIHDAYEDIPLEEVAVDFISLLKLSADNMLEWLDQIDS